ncbi:uncharacterized protein G2W53_032105 [Senna tora]|uniref:Uncharacterized protein n=1 Tax=Senna tora TaxID=362788 RepID=A0A834WBH5_9FABA|nr:uncharacterized protein G2W53_032105 [Senna tora]
MPEISELDLRSECVESEGKISVRDDGDAFPYGGEKSDSFVIDMDAFSPGTINKDTHTNSRITLQRSISRKGWGDKKVNVPTALQDWDTLPTACSPSPKGSGTQPAAASGGPGDHCTSPQVHHQITITAGNITTTAINEGKGIARRNSFKRPPSNWGLDPKRVLLLFATLSSVGSILLIYLTLTISNKQNSEESLIDWQQ